MEKKIKKEEKRWKTMDWLARRKLCRHTKKQRGDEQDEDIKKYSANGDQ